jgi:heat shock protein HslJ
MTTRRLIVLGVAGALALAACGDASDPDARASVPAAPPSAATGPAPTSTTPPSTTVAATTMPPTTAAPDPAVALGGRTFLSTAVEGFTLVAGTRITLVFDGPNVSASGGCNQLGSTWALEGTTLVVPPLAQTEMACDPPTLMDQDTWLASVLTSRPSLALDDQTLTLTAQGATVTFVDREVADPDRPLEGTVWTVDTLVTGDAASSLPAGARPPTLTFEGGSVAVDTGCNTGSGSYTLADGSVTFAPIATTRVACVDPAAAAVEQHVLAVLAGTATVTVEADALTLANGPNGLVARAAQG